MIYLISREWVFVVRRSGVMRCCDGEGRRAIRMMSFKCLAVCFVLTLLKINVEKLD